MDDQKGSREGKSVRDASDQLGHIAQIDGDRAVVRLAGGETVVVANDALIESGEGYRLPSSFAEAEAASRGSEKDRQGQAVIPIVEETIEVGKRRVETGGVRLGKTVSEREEVIDEPIFQEEVEVERRSVGRVLDEPVGVRHEGDTTIIPVLEEVLVVEKKLMLKEELHVTKRRSERREPQRVTLKREEVTVEDLPAGDEPKKRG
jgi:uncharacterized protein (TIGR02271 family)